MAKIIVADDSRSARHYLQQMLEEAGHSVTTAADGVEALALTKEGKPDLLLTDIVMPRMDGYELVARLRADPEVGSTRVVFLTSVYDEPVARSLAKECGVLDTIAKTSEPSVILDAINRALESPPASVGFISSKEFDDEHRQLLINKLAQKIAELERLLAERQRAEQMVVELNAALQQRAEELERRVAERTAELERAKQHAVEADRLKSVFLATMSHELRTPLNSIIGFTGILLQGLAGPLTDEQAKQLRFVQHAGRHLLALINDILDVSKIEAGQIEVHCAPFDLPTSVRTVLESLMPQITSRGLNVSTAIQGVGVVVSDRRRFEQILFNLLSNAIKFTDHGQIKIVVRPTTITQPAGGCGNGPESIAARTASALAGSCPAVEVSVADTGVGISADDLPKLFQPFCQLYPASRKRPEGTGLGLAICKRLVEKLGGTITVESEPGKGSKFTVVIPSGPLPHEEQGTK
ncbi:MAG: ATP-binding protein [Verrucomicrobiae bacterium]|nr:ATP-binding protein [Verrucomicrobiae bacterium]